MRVLVTGSSGLIGSAVVAELERRGDEVIRLIRPPRLPGLNDIVWNPAADYIDRSKVRECDAVIHLAGESIAKRWTAAKKQRIYQSRVKGTGLICDFMEGLEKRPRTFICASAIGYYGDRGDDELAEDEPAGEGFLSEVCRDWEAAARGAEEMGIRTVETRFGIVLSVDGGALAKMLPAFRFGMGAVLAGGEQYWPWVSIEDVVGALMFLLDTRSVTGAVNVVAPEAVTNEEFTRTLGRVLNRPVFLRLPRRVLKGVFGALVEELLLMSARVAPVKLLRAGYKFRDAELEAAMRGMLGK